MGYQHINNLYKNREVLMFREIWAMEKIDGTSAHVKSKGGELTFFHGGGKQETFLSLFDEDFKKAFKEKTQDQDSYEITIYGEFYGGKIQKQSVRYGKEQRFVAFDVKIDKTWLDLERAEKFVRALNLDFVPYEKVNPADIEYLDELRVKPTEQGRKNGVEVLLPREGVVLRPLITLVKNNGERICAKHKNPDFRETREPRKLSDEKLKIIADAKLAAEEWVTKERFKHVADHLAGEGVELSIENVGKFIPVMVEDVLREGEGEFINSKAFRMEIARRTVSFIKEVERSRLKNVDPN